MEPALARMMGWFLILLAILAGYFSFWRAYDKLTSPAWPVTSAEIVRSSMYQRTGKSQDWCVKLAYRYTVEGKAYRSARIGVSRIGNAGCHRDQAVTAWRLASMAPGARIRVHTGRATRAIPPSSLPASISSIMSASASRSSCSRWGCRKHASEIQAPDPSLQGRS